MSKIDKVESEDEFEVKRVCKGLHSRFCKTGRFSTKKEQSVYHFHRILAGGRSLFVGY
tara:strand:+ start:330 stop:503 length:174 start_codon:yes stop_codon:yes gene_type:complete